MQFVCRISTREQLYRFRCVFFPRSVQHKKLCGENCHYPWETLEVQDSRLVFPIGKFPTHTLKLENSDAVASPMTRRRQNVQPSVCHNKTVFPFA